MNHELVQVFDSQSSAYERAFEVFLQHTDQKRNARRWLQRFVETLPTKQTLIDAGAGKGELTNWLAPWFQRTIAIEPNLFLLEELRRTISAAEVIATPILEARPPAPGDLVLCSHIFYYIDRSQWLAHLERLTSWMVPTGATLVVLQDRDTDCMGMMEHFLGWRYDLSEFTEVFQAKYGTRYRIALSRDEAFVETRDLEFAFVIAEFMLNLVPLKAPPRKADVVQYIEDHFSTQPNGYRFSCHQDFLQIRSRD
jgi:hypothetical protein